ncbi:DUF3320 domain-containing protein [Corallococcus sp. M34]|uniref:DUF3320 domain-containing protein n=1 Tax=Citreicoccus inhibens TaxID=2849499 RepID=UPI001C224DF7|nr:DUF3320 domain-containing protein [Citreicoccus inhibens]MBU8900307.1 DUF3320 domain-containing protein [Citreicoccus inhibens]
MSTLDSGPVTSSVRVELLTAPSLNFAMEQSGVPLIREARIRNVGSRALGPTVLGVRLEPELGDSVRIPVPSMPAGEEVSLGVIDLRPPAGHLRTVLETERAQLRWSLQQESQVLAEGTAPVEILPYNHWPGASAPLGLLTTFVTPNHPVIPELLKDVRARLEKAIGEGDLPGYQRHQPQHVLSMMAALYGVIQDLGLSYIEAPPSFESLGQKVRLPDQLLRERMGCCLDVTLLFASALEAMGLHPVVLLVHGHALLATWLIDERFPEGWVEDAARLRNLVSLGALIPFDATAALVAGHPTFEQAMLMGREYLADDANFRAALDVSVLRHDGYRPLPLRKVEAPPADFESTEPARARLHTLLASAAAAAPAQEPPPPPPQVVSRFARWKEKLLDLTLRNKLLNFRLETRGALPLHMPDLATFEDAFSSGESFEIHPAPESSGADARDAKLQLARGTADELTARRQQDLDKGLLHSPLRESELWARARHLERTARTDLEEGGAHTLYLALGLLRWLEPGDPTPRLAPLILYPATFRIDRARKRLRIERLADEPMGNVTLAEKLKQDFGLDARALTALEADEKGLDVPSILRAVRTAIQSRAGWEVLEEAHVGLFAFTKFLMWKDLADNEAGLLSNPLVRHIAAAGTSAPPVGGTEFNPETLDAEVPVADLPCVVNGDSTQLAAIASALSGRSFVLQGPPGTGKSQTITNLIAAAVARGKSVLFVSEKMAALEVVHRRLKDVGLDDFCLELHSHKSNKKEVLESFGRAQDRMRGIREPPWEDRSRELGKARTALNDYVRAVHQRWPLGQSSYDGTNRLLRLRAAPSVALPHPAPEALTESELRAAQEEVASLVSPLRNVRALGAHPWGAVRGVHWTNALEDQLLRMLGEVRTSLDGVDATATGLASTLGLESTPNPTAKLRDLAELGLVLSSGPLPSAAQSSEGWTPTAQRIREQAGCLREQSSREADVASRWSPSLFSLELTPLQARFEKWAGAFVLFAFLFLWSARRLLTPHATRVLPGNRDIARDLTTARQIIAGRQRIETQGRALEEPLRVLSPAEQTQPDALESLIQRASQTRDLKEALGVARLQLPGTSAARDALRTQATALERALERLARAEAALAETVKAHPWEQPTSPRHRGSLRSQVEDWKSHLRALKPWCQYQTQADRIRALGFSAFVDAVEQESVAPEALSAVFERAVLTTWSRALRDSEPALRDFDADAHTGRIERFRQLDLAHVGLSRQRVLYQLEQRLPVGLGASAESSEPGILARELRKKRGQMALRKLLASIPNLARRLKPCFLMSPLSVAQYLPADGQRFDLLVFDEASQIGTHDAIGAMARANQVIVVGDSKQLPPTSFFSRGEDAEATPDENDVVELESILEEALAKQFPQQMLGWHYRSRHDSLIDFSNRQYYEGRLQVFPAARARVADLGVKWHPVPDGVYQSKTSGKTAAINPREAEALVAELVKALRKHTPQERTFGVVTFSMVQQQVILDLLDAERAKHPELEAHFTSSEPVFVKNLENVQGDERDEIFFSICYAKDTEGKLRMNFGPLSRAGGERRLNVAVTRARCALRIFSTLTHEQIDLSRTTSVGARHLREFLRRAAESASPSSTNTREPEDALPQDVAASLRALGYTVHSDVGTGGYRVDLAVEHPSRPGEYVLGVECDGPHYRAASSARDRERLRPEVLQGLGWRLARVWSLAWEEDRAGQLQRLAAAVKDAVEGAPLAAVAPRLEDPSAEAAIPSAPPAEQPGATTSARGAAVQAYVPATLPAVREGADFFAPTSASRLREQLQSVLEQEGPIHEELLARRIQEAWGLGKLTPRVRKRMEEQLAELVQRGAILAQGEFLWAGSRRPAQFTGFRGAHDDRDVSQIPPEELANAAAAVLAHALSMERDELLRETGRHFGVSRLTRTVVPVLEAGLELLAREGRCTLAGERVIWRE